jgi:hypothetical protein
MTNLPEKFPEKFTGKICVICKKLVIRQDRKMSHNGLAEWPCIIKENKEFFVFF